MVHSSKGILLNSKKQLTTNGHTGQTYLTNIILSTKDQTQESILSTSVYTKFKMRQNSSMTLEVRRVATLTGGGRKRRDSFWECQ